jgi:3-methyladenine DNA glycosylase/8-oxoguanine DNA glycosylase
MDAVSRTDSRYRAPVPRPRVFHEETAALVDLDGRFGPLVEQHGPFVLEPRPRPAARFESIAATIAHQQLNGTAARTIWGRVRALVDGPFVPESVLALDDADLRAAGLSGAKVRAVRDLAARTADGSLALGRLGRLDDDGVVAELTQVWGVGLWTAHMVLLFDLHRLDIWPTGDYGVRAGWARITGTDQLPDASDLAAAGAHLAPYRSLAAWYCWRAADG